ncbi:hypothetical protein HGRIS_011450 [Hohenbuehelia grisea]|uniref:Plethodontid modulating factor n=1 Tax=Hohenbuehelia grisea TaxID=104357 RepID=A0ABR3JWH0_9AGAR
MIFYLRINTARMERVENTVALHCTASASVISYNPRPHSKMLAKCLALFALVSVCNAGLAAKRTPEDSGVAHEGHTCTYWTEDAKITKTCVGEGDLACCTSHYLADAKVCMQRSECPSIDLE